MFGTPKGGCFLCGKEMLLPDIPDKGSVYIITRSCMNAGFVQRSFSKCK